MFDYGTRSQDRLETCHKDIQLIFNEAIKFYDISILEGIRSDETQLEYYETGRSQLDGKIKKSKHQGKVDEDGNIVSYAIDCMPYKKGTNAFSGKEEDKYRFYFLAGLIYSITERLYNKGKITHKIRWGGDWAMDMVYHPDREFTDLPHFELVEA